MATKAAEVVRSALKNFIPTSLKPTGPRRVLKKVIRTFKVPIQFGSEHGHQIFVYTNIRTNQVVYSLTRTLNNHASLKQLPFLGKKTVPAALRKDLWTSLCVLSFPNTYQGLHAYAKLREYRHLHETAYPLSTVTQTEGKHKGQLLPKRKKGLVLMNQKANSVADMAAVLHMQAQPPSKEAVIKAKGQVRVDGRPAPKRGLGRKPTASVFEFQGKLGKMSIWWASLRDAEYAKTWPDEVTHGRLAVNRGTAIWPPPVGWAFEEVKVQREVEFETIVGPDGKEIETEVLSDEVESEIQAVRSSDRRALRSWERVKTQEKRDNHEIQEQKEKAAEAEAEAVAQLQREMRESAPSEPEKSRLEIEHEPEVVAKTRPTVEAEQLAYVEQDGRQMAVPVSTILKEVPASVKWFDDGSMSIRDKIIEAEKMSSMRKEPKPDEDEGTGIKQKRRPGGRDGKLSLADMATAKQPSATL